MKPVGAIAVAACAWLGCATPAVEPRPPLTDGRYVMGTIFEVTLPAGTPAPVFEQLFEAARALDQQLSVYDGTSDVSRLNREAGRGPIEVAEPVREILASSVDYARRTGGTFDVTIGPLVELWIRAARSGRLPTGAEIAAARARVGSEKIAISADGTVALGEGMSIDLGGVAKGYALDRMLPLLRESGADSALLSFGQSSTWALGAPEGSPGWRLLVRGPEDDFVGLITLRDQALSVSGSLGQFVEIQGRRYGHIIDPRTGQPLLRRRQALVLAPSAALAEALSKAMLILDASEALALVAAQPGCDGLLVESGGRQLSTPGWARSARFEPLPENR